MKTKTVLLATTALAALAFTAPANAAGWYASLTGGANWQDDDGFFAANGPDTLTFASNSDTGFVIAGAIGYSLTNVAPGLRVEAELSYRQNSNDGLWSTTTGGEGDAGTLDFDHSATAVLANVWYDFDVGGVRPYVGGGIGWADVEVDGTYVGGTLPAIDFSDDGFAWQAGAGINFAISPNMQLGVGYRYFSGPEVTVLAPFGLNSAASDLDYDNHAAVVTLTFGM